MAASNTIECIEELVGEKLLGVIERWPKRSDITGAKALVFDSGRALILCDNGSYWVETKGKTDDVIEILRQEHERGVKNVERMLALAGQKVSA